MVKPRLLWVGDNIRPTGFERVTSSLLRRLCDRFEVIPLAVNHAGDPHSEPYQVYPASIYGDPLGRDRIRDLAEQLHPDIIVAINDIWVLYDYWERVKDLGIPFVAYFPVDSFGYVPTMVTWLENVARVITYTDFGLRVLRDAGLEKHVDVLPHGVDIDVFHPIPKLEARKEFGIDEQSFIVFCGQRNQSRKRIDLTIKGFCRFASRHSHKPIKLHLHMGTKDRGWDILALFKREALSNGLTDWQRYLSLTSNSIRCQDQPVERLNLIYNCADVGINTSLGEGWGLVSFEHAACNVAQIAPDHSAPAELFASGRGYLLPVRQWITDTDFNLERGLVDHRDVCHALEYLYQNPEFTAEMAHKAYTYVIRSAFNWDVIADKLHDLMQRTLVVSSIQQESMMSSAAKKLKNKPKGFAIK